MRGEWIEIAANEKLYVTKVSPLMRGEWIEMSLYDRRDIFQLSPLMRGEWIEMLVCRGEIYLSNVSPHARGVD